MMDNYSKQDKDFLDGVWAKVRYMEYLRDEQELIRQNSRRLLAARIKLAAILIAIVIVISVPILLLNGLEIGSMLGVGMLLLGAGAFFDYYEEKDANRRVSYGNKY